MEIQRLSPKWRGDIFVLWALLHSMLVLCFFFAWLAQTLSNNAMLFSQKALLALLLLLCAELRKAR